MTLLARAAFIAASQAKQALWERLADAYDFDEALEWTCDARTGVLTMSTNKKENGL